MVLPCDLVCELGGDKLLQAWMVKSASLSELLGDPHASEVSHSGGLGVWYQTKTATPVKGEETDFIATAPLPSAPTLPPKDSLLPHISKLVYSMPKDSLKDLMDEKRGFPIRHGLLRRHPKLKMLSTHRDAHLYILPRWIMDFVQENERLESIGEDVIGWWAKASWQTGLSKKLGITTVLESSEAEDENTSAQEDDSISPDDADTEELRRDNLSGGFQIRSDVTHYNQESGDAAQSTDQEIIPQMLAYIHPSTQSAPLIRRADTAQLLLSISLQLAKLPSVEEVGVEPASPFAHTRKVAYPEGVKPRTTITRQDSLVADNVTVEEKTSIKESVIGANCQIREGAKLSQCLLMDGVVVGKGCKLTRCILGKRCEIGENSVLTDCEVQENLLVEAKSELKILLRLRASTLYAQNF